MKQRGRLIALTLVAAGVLAGGAVSAAAFTLIDNPGAPAPKGTEPGAPIVTELGEVTSVELAESRGIPLTGVPDGATHVRVTVACLTEGSSTWGLAANGNNPGSACSSADAGTAGAAWYDFALSGTADTLYVDVASGRFRVSLQYLDSAETAWGVNESGETYGTAKDGLGDPDLVSVIGRGPGGEEITGYARSSDLMAFGPEWPQPTSPEQALTRQEERDAKYPDGWDIPVYESDGVTQIGTFHTGG